MRSTFGKGKARAARPTNSLKGSTKAADPSTGSLPGDRAALDDLLRQFTPYLRHATRSVLGPAGAEAEDCLQETLVAVSAALHSFRAESSLLHFAVSIATRRARGARRRLRSGQQREMTAMQLEAPLLVPPQPPEESALRAERIAALRSLLDQLPHRQADVLTMRVLLGKSLAEVARATGAPVNTVRSRLRLAREALRGHIVDDSTLRELLLRDVTR